MVLMSQLEALSTATPILNLFVCLLFFSVPRKIFYMWKVHKGEPNVLRTLLIGDMEHVKLFMEKKNIGVYAKFKPVAIITNINKAKIIHNQIVNNVVFVKTIPFIF